MNDSNRKERLHREFVEGQGSCATLFSEQPWLDFVPVTSSLVVTDFGGRRDVSEPMREIAEQLSPMRRDFETDWISAANLFERISTTSSGTPQSPCVSVARAELIRCPISNEQKQHDQYVEHEHYEDKEWQSQNERLDAIDEIDQGPIGDGHQSAPARKQYSVCDSFLHERPVRPNRSDEAACLAIWS